MPIIPQNNTLTPPQGKTVRRPSPAGFFLRRFTVSLLLPISFITTLLSETTVPSAPLSETDSVAVNLQEVEVISSRGKYANNDIPDATTLDVDALGKIMRVGGEADPLRYVRLMPGIGVGSDYSAGISVDGADPSQSLVTVDGAPLFFPYHFGGLFSILNESHFPKVTLRKSIHPVSMPSRLGGYVSVDSRDYPVRKPLGEVNVGMMASSLSASAPLSQNTSVAISGRIAYLNLLYGWLLKGHSTDISYSFGDGSLSFNWLPSEKDRVKITLLANSDHLVMSERDMLNDIGMRWRNAVASASWIRTDHNLTASTTTFFSYFHNRLGISLPGQELHAPSGIWQTGVKTDLDIPLGHEIPSDNIDSLAYDQVTGPGYSHWLSVGGELNLSSYAPQSAVASGMVSADSPNIWTRCFEARLFAGWNRRLPVGLTLSAGLKGSLYGCGSYHSVHLLPMLTGSWQRGEHRLVAHISAYPQYLHQIGFSEIGLSSNFWIGASKRVPAQLALAASLAWEYDPAPGWRLKVEPYWKRILRQPEYVGMVFDLVDPDYDAENHIQSVSGFNTGCSLTLSGAVGPVSGWAGYSLGIARRKYPDFPDRLLPANTEPLHSGNIFLAWTISDRWRTGLNFVMASGRPVTPVREVYMLGETVIVSYGTRNSDRLPLYHRLDLSATYTCVTRLSSGRSLRHYFNLSLINAYGQRNVEFAYYRLYTSDYSFRQRRVYSLIRFMPSLSYTLEFR